MTDEIAKLSFGEAKERLCYLREKQLRSSEEVVDIWNYVLSRNPAQLGDEVWVVYEQVVVAALDCNAMDLADYCLRNLRAEFPKSHRVYKLYGLSFEAQGKFEQALEIYDSILKDDPTNSVSRKRKVAIKKAEGNFKEAIEILNEFLKICQTDQEGWMELCDLYLHVHDYQKAAFCMEELMMTNPNNHLFHQKYAEILYTMNKHEDIISSRSYFAQAYKLSPSNNRALFGLWLAAANLAVHPKSNGKQKNDNKTLAQWAKQQIAGKYIECQSSEEHDNLLFLNENLQQLTL